MLSRRTISFRPITVGGFGAALGAGEAALEDLGVGSALTPGFDMLPLQLAFMPSVPNTHLSIMAAAFLFDTNPNL